LTDCDYHTHAGVTAGAPEQSTGEHML
jgi:hypothetical protein